MQAAAAAVTLGRYFPTVADAYLRDCFADLSIAAAAGLEDYSAGQQETSDVAAYHLHYSVAQVAEDVACLLHLTAVLEAAAAAVEAVLAVG